MGARSDRRPRSGSRVLEIGTGWGALAIRAAQRGATVTSLTISAEQRKLALGRVRDAGLHDRVAVHLRDYREEQIEDSARDHTRLRIAETRSFGDDYAETPRRWRATFLTRWDEVARLGFDDTFRRMREFCLACSEAGFRVGYLGVQQFGMAERLGH
jgi:cyclopropane fatty-acyl-phospholipid synthase-like methyltransferase